MTAPVWVTVERLRRGGLTDPATVTIDLNKLTAIERVAWLDDKARLWFPSGENWTVANKYADVVRRLAPAQVTEA